jgi:hypothetical protein
MQLAAIKESNLSMALVDLKHPERIAIFVKQASISNGTQPVSQATQGGGWH